MASRARMYQRLPDFTPAWSAGNRSLSQIISGVRTTHFDVHISATVTIGTADANAILNGGNLAALFSFIGINENGTDVCNWPATMMHALTQRVAARVPSDVVLNAVGQAAYNLRTIIRIPMRWPWGRAAETAYVEADPAQNTFVFLVPKSDLSTANGILVEPGSSGTAAITNLKVNVFQAYDDLSVVSPPFFVPQFDTINQAVAAGGTDIPLFLRSAQLLRGVMVETTNTAGGFSQLLSPGIITDFRLKDDLKTYIGEPMTSVPSWLMQESIDYAGDVFGLGSDFFINFQQWGQLSKVYNPARAGTNLRLEINQAVPGGSTNNQIYGGLIKLVRITGRTRDGLPEGMDGI